MSLQQSPEDLRKIISKDFAFSKIVENTRTSKIRQMMTQKISIASFDNDEEEKKESHPFTMISSSKSLTMK